MIELAQVLDHLFSTFKIEQTLNIIFIIAIVYLWKRAEQKQTDTDKKCEEITGKYEALLEKSIAAIEQMNTMKSIEEAIKSLRRDKE